MNAPSSADRWPFPAAQGAPGQGQPGHPQQRQRQPGGQPAQGRPAQQRPAQARPTQAYPPQGYPVQQAGYAPQQRQQVIRRPAEEPAPIGRRLIGFAVFLVLTGLSLPVHVMAVFFVYLQFESPGDKGSAVLLIAAAFLGSFIALLVTGVLSQLAGGFRGGWRTRVVFAICSAVLSLAIAYLAALTLF